MRSRQPRQLLLALLGEFVIDGDPRPVPASAFIEVFDAAGIAAPATRATLDRVEQRGLITRERRGREIVFSPTPTGIAVLREATARVRDPHPFHAPLGLWTFVAFSLPEDLRGLRSRLRSTLTWEGFAPLRDGLWVAPGEIDLNAALEAMRADLPPGAILAFLGRELTGFPMADSARSAWDIDAIRAEHLAFIDTWSTFDEDDSSSALVTRTMLVADWLALLRADPGLPRELLDDDWPADLSLSLYRDLRAQTTEPAMREFAGLVGGRPPNPGECKVISQPTSMESDTKEFRMSSNGTPLGGKVAIVTGSGRGLGLAYAAELARQGASVVVNDVDAQTAADAVASIEAQGGKAVGVVAAVGSTETAKALVAAAVDNFGRLDILVTNAGVLRDTVLWKMSDEDFDTVINVHLRGTFTCVRESVTYMRENEIAGRVICIGSPTGQRGNFGQTNYAAAKAGIVGMVRTWALELKRAGITANAVIPVAATAMTATVPYFAAAVEAEEKGEPMPAFFRHDLGFGTSDDVAGLIAYLASDAASGVTGQAIGVGGDRVQVWSHPEPVLSAYRDGGWTYDALAADFGDEFGGQLQSVGEKFPPLPEDLQR